MTRTQVGECVYRGCRKHQFSRHLCSAHYSEWWRGGAKGWRYNPAGIRITMPTPTTIPVDGEWRDLAACKGTDPNLWFAKQAGANYKSERFDQARNICADCPVLMECHQWVLGLSWEQDVAGIIAGMDPGQRTYHRRQQRKQRAR